MKGNEVVALGWATSRDAGMIGLIGPRRFDKSCLEQSISNIVVRFKYTRPTWLEKRHERKPLMTCLAELA